MDIATLIGIVVAFGALLAMITMEGAHVSSILLPAPIILVLGATVAVGIASGTMADALRAAKALPKAFLAKVPRPHEAIEQIVSLAEKARTEGQLALEQDAETTEDDFLRDALQNIADGTDPEDLRNLLEDRIDTKARQDRTTFSFYSGMGGYAPTIGIVGTVVSLTHVLENLSDPEHLGPMIAAAFVATLWGVMSANFIWLPIAAKLRRISDLEVERMTILLEGCLAIQAGSQPRAVGERLRAMVPAYVVPEVEAA